MDIKFIGNKYTNKSSRNGCKIIAIVNHITACGKQACIDWFTTSNNKESSAHYLVCKDGSIYQFVTDNMKSWHGGIVKNPSSRLVLSDMIGINPNAYTIGIEHEGQSGDQFTKLQYQSTLELHKQLIQKYGIIIDREHIIGHYQIDNIDRPYCPGSGFPWERLISDLTTFFTQPQIEKWRSDTLDYLVSNNFISKNHNPLESLTYEILGFMYNNITTKLNPIGNVMDYLVNQKLILPNGTKQSKDIINWGTIGYIFANILREKTTNPIQFMLDKKIISKPKDANLQMNLSDFGACIMNFKLLYKF